MKALFSRLSQLNKSDLETKELLEIIEACNDLQLVTDLNGIITDLNPNLSPIFDYQSNDLLGKPLLSFIHPDDQAIFRNFQQDGKRKSQARLQKKDGSSLRMLWSRCHLPERQSYCFGAVDLTEIRDTGAPLARPQSKLEQVLRDGMIGYWEVDFRTGVLTVTDNIRKWWSIPEDLIITNEIYLELLHPEDLDKVTSVQKAIMETLKPQELIHRTRRPDGKFLWINGTGHPMLDEDGKVIGLMGTSMDITQRVELEAALKHHQAKMITSSRLSAIGEMASSMAHEINNPLAIIHLHAQALKEQILDRQFSTEVVQQKAEKISQTALRISRIIRSLRTLSRDGQDDPCEPISVRRILEETLEICRQKFLNGQIQLKLEIPDKDLLILARPTQISQVFLNLLNNAYDAVEKLEKPWVEVSISGTDVFVEVRVKDSGLGVPAELQEKIFDPFFTTKDPTRGTGLGLSVSRSIIASHMGSLHLNPGAANTEFIIQLPTLPRQR